jgi:spore germination protein
MIPNHLKTREETMQIHVVQPGQTLFQLSQTYGVPVNTISEANQISVEKTLVIGQALIIPIVGKYYWIQPGDSLYLIAKKFSVNMQTLAEVNRLDIKKPLKIGVRLYIPPLPRRAAEINSYIEPRRNEYSPALIQSANETAHYLTYLAPFSFRINRDGSLQAPPLDDLNKIAGQHNVTLMMVVTNLEKDQFSADLGAAFLNNDQIQNTLLDNIIRTAKQMNFRDIHFDIEHLHPEDKEAYNRFLRQASN